ncbi:hypothetical protein [Streptomyces sp. ST2-7A]|uniref:hypothetical protein n=1 Tax=Streptomyces sp. ST2-7A TaxID=2907214 RepID=UPI001F19D95B|nr:hypothetical protein [Streptomyces sp. ST2-7A]MCE7081182.1 hypothetical protein [Streptomyces sp. ST2-7A]
MLSATATATYYDRAHTAGHTTDLARATLDQAVEEHRDGRTPEPPDTVALARLTDPATAPQPIPHTLVDTARTLTAHGHPDAWQAIRALLDPLGPGHPWPPAHIAEQLPRLARLTRADDDGRTFRLADVAAWYRSHTADQPTPTPAGRPAGPIRRTLTRTLTRARARRTHTTPTTHTAG